MNEECIKAVIDIYNNFKDLDHQLSIDALKFCLKEELNNIISKYEHR